MNEIATRRPTPEKYRPAYHFSPPENWMNDPNGLVFVNGRYHLFYQHNPGEDVWGNMHWGHASSTDLLSWVHHKPAICPGGAPDEFVFSGCCVHDRFNESGLAKERVNKGVVNKAVGPIIAFYTFSDERGGCQRQCISYSCDEGVSWRRYAGNPILPNAGRADYRDPKVFWYADGDYWSMIVAAGQELLFYRSRDLLTWKPTGSFSVPWTNNAGCWECPDLFEMAIGPDKRWVLLASVNPGDGDSGYATQYFVGSFNGETFIPDHQDCRWLDCGPDFFAAVTWEAARGVDIPRICIGWMNNWSYAEKVPTAPWRGQMSVPRTLHLAAVGNDHYLRSEPAALPACVAQTEIDVELSDNRLEVATTTEACEISLTIIADDPDALVSLRLENSHGEALSISWDRAGERLLVDRSHLKSSVDLGNFTAICQAPLPGGVGRELALRALVDRCSVEVFAADGLVCLTALHFPELPLTTLAGSVEHGFASIVGRVSQLTCSDLPTED